MISVGERATNAHGSSDPSGAVELRVSEMVSGTSRPRTRTELARAIHHTRRGGGSLPPSRGTSDSSWLAGGNVGSILSAVREPCNMLAIPADRFGLGMVDSWRLPDRRALGARVESLVGLGHELLRAEKVFGKLIYDTGGEETRSLDRAGSVVLASIGSGAGW